MLVCRYNPRQCARLATSNLPSIVLAVVLGDNRALWEGFWNSREADLFVAQILVVEDHAKLRANLQELLESEGHTTVGAGTFVDAHQAVLDQKFDLVVLDLGLPGGDGLELLGPIRKQSATLPVMILTARDAIEDRVRGLDAGADDYLIKPFAHSEFLARSRALLRRHSGPRESVIRFAGLELDFIARTVLRDEVLIELSQREFELLEYLLRHKDQNVSREMLAKDVWKEPAGILTNAIDVCINSLRRKIELPGLPKVITTIRGVGYMIRDDA